MESTPEKEPPAQAMYKEPGEPARVQKVSPAAVMEVLV